jgi:hypothetical protein
VYSDGPGVDPSETIVVEPAALATLMTAFALGDKALREFAPSETPTLWPEHFDVAIRLDNVNYGVSPGDGYLSEPYAYVGPNETPAGEFWNAPFGAARPVSEFEGYEAVVSFFRAGQAALVEGSAS